MRRYHVIFFLHTDNLMGNFRHGAQREFLTRKNAEYKPAGRAFLDDIRDASKAMSRSVNAQAEYWIRLGMMSELYPELNHQQIKLLMLKSGSDRLLEVINAINNH